MVSPRRAAAPVTPRRQRSARTSDRVSMAASRRLRPRGAPRSASPWEAVLSAPPRPPIHARGLMLSPGRVGHGGPVRHSTCLALIDESIEAPHLARAGHAPAPRGAARLPTRAAGAARAEAQPRGPGRAGSSGMSMSQAALYRSRKQPLLAARCTPRERCRRRHHNAARLRRRLSKTSDGGRRSSTAAARRSRRKRQLLAR